MSPSVKCSNTTSALLRPLCGRTSAVFATLINTGRRLSLALSSGNPVNGFVPPGKAATGAAFGILSVVVAGALVLAAAGAEVGLAALSGVAATVAWALALAAVGAAPAAPVALVAVGKTSGVLVGWAAAGGAAGAGAAGVTMVTTGWNVAVGVALSRLHDTPKMAAIAKVNGAERRRRGDFVRIDVWRNKKFKMSSK